MRKELMQEKYYSFCLIVSGKIAPTACMTLPATTFVSRLKTNDLSAYAGKTIHK
ncbi:MAG: hypothetical protein MRK02_14220 [Candidatus Scalindua sp.]|nr:hypothetical protein [Candidatus Scalindua sp.]